LGKLCMEMTPNAERLGEGIWVSYAWIWPHVKGLREGMRVVGKFVKGPSTEGLGEGTRVTLVMKHVYLLSVLKILRPN